VTTSNPTTSRIPIGNLVKDADTGRIGRIVQYWPDSADTPSLAYISPLTGGKTWTADPGSLTVVDEVRKGELL